MNARALEYRQMKNCYCCNTRMRHQLEAVYKYAKALKCDLKTAWQKWIDSGKAKEWAEQSVEPSKEIVHDKRSR